MIKILNIQLLLMVSLVLTSACSNAGLTTPAASTQTPTNTPVLNQSPPEVPDVEEASPEETETGPWLMLPGPDGLWVYDLAANQLFQSSDKHLLAPQDIAAIPSPAGGYAAYITGENGIENLRLNILSLPRNLAQTIPLIADAYFPSQDTPPDAPAAQAVRALFEATSLAWSPDGHSLAFTAVLDGPTADLYVLNLEDLDADAVSDRYTRLSDGPSQAVQPTWSPDGRTIIHAAVENFGTGAGYQMAGVWASKADGSSVKLLYTPADSGGESFVGWLDDRTLLVHSWSAVCGSYDLRTLDIETGAQQPIWKPPFNQVALNPGSGSILLSIDTFTSNCPGAAPQGLYFLGSPSTPHNLVVETEAFLPTWVERAGLFLARTPERVLAVEPDGTAYFLQAPEPTLPDVSINRHAAWASASTGIWIADLDKGAAQIFDGPAYSPAWSPDGRSIFFFGEQGLYRVHTPDWEPELIGEGLVSGGVIWLDTP